MKHLFDTLAEVVAQENIGHCFSLLGDANMNFATRLGEAGCQMIYVRHEHCAVAAAMAYARKTGDIGLATVTCGPGLTQLMTALPAAVRARLPASPARAAPRGCRHPFRSAGTSCAGGVLAIALPGPDAASLTDAAPSR